jgi:hypothetical protein
MRFLRLTRENGASTTGILAVGGGSRKIVGKNEAFHWLDRGRCSAKTGRSKGGCRALGRKPARAIATCGFPWETGASPRCGFGQNPTKARISGGGRLAFVIFGHSPPLTN